MIAITIKLKIDCRANVSNNNSNNLRIAPITGKECML